MRSMATIPRFNEASAAETGRQCCRDNAARQFRWFFGKAELAVLIVMPGL